MAFHHGHFAHTGTNLRGIGFNSRLILRPFHISEFCKLTQYVQTMTTECEQDRAKCAISDALTVLGDRWSLLVVRDVLRGINRFDSLQDSLHIARNILAQRLSSLEEAGVLVKSPIKPNGKRMCYNPTPKCLGLIPVLVSLIDWTANWSGKDQKRWSKVIDKTTGEEVKIGILDKDNNPVSMSQLSIQF